MVVEGVRYYRFHIRFRLADGTRKRITRWAPALMYMRESLARELVDRYGSDGIAPGSVRIELASC